MTSTHYQLSELQISKTIPLKVKTHEIDQKKIPKSPIIEDSEFPILPNLYPDPTNTFLEEICDFPVLPNSKDPFLKDDMHLVSPGPPTPIVEQQIIEYIELMANLLNKSSPAIDECFIKVKLAGLYPSSNPTELINKIIAKGFIHKEESSEGEPSLSITQ